MMSHSLNIREEAEVRRLLLIMGVISTSNVVEWADGLIERRDHVPGWLLDICLTADSDDASMLSKLNGLPLDVNGTLAAYAALDRFEVAFRAGHIQVIEAAAMLARWAATATLSHADQSTAAMPSSVASEIDCGLASEENVACAIEDCLAHFVGKERKART